MVAKIKKQASILTRLTEGKNTTIVESYADALNKIANEKIGADDNSLNEAAINGSGNS